MKNTFGSTLAAQKLEKLLEDNPSARRKVSRLLSSYTSKLFNITGARDPETVLTCMHLLRDYTLARVDIQKGLTAKERTFTKNVVTCRYRVYRKGFESLIPALLKKMAQEKDLTSGNKGV
jgi:hypothetical protein